MEKVWILGGMRSFIGVKDRMYRNVPAEVLGAEVLRAVIEKYQLAECDIDFIIGGNAVGGGGNMTRLAALTAGLEQEIPAVSLDLQCGSALEAVTQAAAKIESGLADLVLAGGMESSSTQPLRMWNMTHLNYEKDQGVDGGAVYTGAAGRAGHAGRSRAHRNIGARDKRRTGFLGAGEPPSGSKDRAEGPFIGHSGIGGGKSEG